MSALARPHLDPTATGPVAAGVLVFDVNETLLDLDALTPLFEEIFGDAGARGEWFAQLLRCSMVAAITKDERDFSQLGDAALRMIAARRGADVAETDRRRILERMLQLPPHPDAEPALGRLGEGGFRLAALTNSASEAAHRQLEHAGLDRFFEEILSVDAVGRFKPAPEVYLHAAARLGVQPAGLWLVAAHDWDVTGALRAGCRAAFVARPGKVLDPGAPQPEVVGKDLTEVSEALLRLRR